MRGKRGRGERIRLKKRDSSKVMHLPLSKIRLYKNYLNNQYCAPSHNNCQLIIKQLNSLKGNNVFTKCVMTY